MTLAAAPFTQGNVSFRSSSEDECYMGEPMLLAKDLWKVGLGNILAVPNVNVAYEYESAREAKDVHGYVHNIVQDHAQYYAHDELVQWKKDPPPKVKCMPAFDRQWWVTPI